MKRTACLIMIMILAVFSVDAAEKRNRSFTNYDIEKYKDQSESNSSHKSDSNRNNMSDGSLMTYKAEDNNLQKYVVPYTGSSRRIIVPVTFNGRITAPMLLDTGAPNMHISYKLAEELGVIEKKDNELRVLIGGIGGTTPAILTVIDSISVGEAGAHFIPTFVSDPISRNFDGLIGMGFMTKYSVQIDTTRRVVIFEELPADIHMPGGHDEYWWRSTFHNFRSIKSQWDEYRNKISKRSSYTDSQKAFRLFVNNQYEKASELHNRLSVYASEHSVPLEWR